LSHDHCEYRLDCIVVDGAADAEFFRRASSRRASQFFDAERVANLVSEFVDAGQLAVVASERHPEIVVVAGAVDRQHAGLFDEPEPDADKRFRLKDIR